MTALFHLWCDEIWTCYIRQCAAFCGMSGAAATRVQAVRVIPAQPSFHSVLSIIFNIIKFFNLHFLFLLVQYIILNLNFSTYLILWPGKINKHLIQQNSLQISIITQFISKYFHRLTFHEKRAQNAHKNEKNS